MAAVLKPRLEPQDDFTPPQIELRELRTIEQAVALLDEWRCHSLKLETDNAKLRWRLDYLESLLEHLDPFLPEGMQNPQLQARFPEHYRAIRERKEQD